MHSSVNLSEISYGDNVKCHKAQHKQGKAMELTGKTKMSTLRDISVCVFLGKPDVNVLSLCTKNIKHITGY